jgi:hypothetical protein
MAEGTGGLLSRGALSGLFAALNDPERVVSVAALRALVRLPLDTSIAQELRPYRAAVERRDFAWSTWIPDATERTRIGEIVGPRPDAESLRAIASKSSSPIVQSFAQSYIDDPGGPSDELSGKAEQLSAEIQRLGVAHVPNIDELFALYRAFLPNAAQFWFDWVAGHGRPFDPANELPSYFPLHEGALAASRQLEWIASRVPFESLLSGLDTPLRDGDAGDKFAAAQLIEWARRYAGQQYHPQFGGGSAPNDVLAPIDSKIEYKAYSADELPTADARAAPPPKSAALPTPSDAESERRINVWISDPSRTGYRPTVGAPCVVSINVGAPQLLNLADGDPFNVARADIPSGGLMTRWTVAPRHASLSAPTIPASITASGLVVFDLVIPHRGESPTVSLSVTTTSDDASLAILIQVGDKRWRELDVPLDGSGKLKRDAAVATLALAQINTSHEWTTPPGEVGLWVYKPATVHVTGTVNGLRASSGLTIDIGSDKALLSGAVDNVRKAADGFRKVAKWSAYLNDIDETQLLAALAGFKPQYDWSQFNDFSDATHGAAWQAACTSDELFKLAFYGRELYDTLFPPGKPGRALLDGLLPGHRINIDWLPSSDAGWVAHLPWELLYRGDVTPGVPVDATSFWGLRHRIQYSLYDPIGPASNQLGEPLQASCTNLLFFGSSAAEPATAEALWQRSVWQSLGKASRAVMVPQSAVPSPKKELVQALIEPERIPGPAALDVAVLYFFCHYGADNKGEQILRFGLNSADPNDVIHDYELGKAPFASRPLVFANGCATAGTDVYSASLIAKSFFSRGCRAYIGSECMVPVTLASRLAMIFFHFLLRQVDPGQAPITAGEALVQARLFLWCHYRNVGGLLYSYLNQYDLYLASSQELAALRGGAYS